jgi:hypothetical protein
MRRHIRSQTTEEHLDHGRYPDVGVSTHEAVLIISGPMLCRLHVWTDEQWVALPKAERLAQCIYAPGLGWVGAIPVACMN